MFRKCCLFTAAELVRHTRGYNFCSVEDLALAIPVEKLELLCVIDLTLNVAIGKLMTKLMIARVMEIAERIMEYDIWNQDGFYVMLSNPTSYTSNYTFILYDEVALPASAHGAAEANMRASLHLQHQPRLLKLLLEKINELQKQRLLHLCAALSISESEMMKSCKFFSAIIEADHTLELLKNRSLDVIMLCCLFCALSYGDNPISWNVVIGQYQKQPQYFKATTHQVYLNDSTPASDIKYFFANVFIPKVKSAFGAMNEKFGSEPALLTPSRKSKSYKVNDGGVPVVAMTPITRKLSTISPFNAEKRSAATPPSGRGASSRKLGYMRTTPGTPLVNMNR